MVNRIFPKLCMLTLLVGFLVPAPTLGGGAYGSSLAVATLNVDDNVPTAAPTDRCNETCPTFVACQGTDLMVVADWQVRDYLSDGLTKNARFSLSATDIFGNSIAPTYTWTESWTSSSAPTVRTASDDTLPMVTLPGQAPGSFQVDAVVDFWAGPASGAPTASATASMVVTIASCDGTTMQPPICDLPEIGNFQFLVKTVSDSLPDMGVAPLSPNQQDNLAVWAYDAFYDLAIGGSLAFECLSSPAGHYVITLDFSYHGVDRLNVGVVSHDSDLGRTSMRYWTFHPFSAARSGPYFDNYALIGAQANVQTTNYAGREYWKGTHWISQAQQDIQVPAIFNPNVAPSNVPAGYRVDPVLTIWIGVSPQTGGAGGLAQTGIIKDTVTAANGDYSAFYEFHDGGPALTKFPGPLNIPVGNYNQQMIQQDDVSTGKCCIKFDATVKDLTAKKGSTALFSTGKVNYEAKRVLYIAETPTYRQAPAGQPMRDVYQQMPGLNSPIGFYDAWFYDSTSNFAYETRSTAVTNEAKVLVQSSLRNPSTADAWNTGAGGFFNRAGYHTVTRLSSAYDWNCAMLKRC